MGDADWPTERELKVTAILYVRLGAVAHLRETGRLADRIGGTWNSIPMSLVLRERGTDPTLTEEEQLVYDAIVREHRLPGGAVRLISESSPPEKPDAHQVGEGLSGKRRAGQAPDVRPDSRGQACRSPEGSDEVTRPTGPGSAAAPQAEMLPAELRTFVNQQTWTFGKTMPEWPHEYLVRDRVDEGLFVRLVEHIRAHGYEGHFYQKTIIYYEEAGTVYWTMGSPLDETIIINRCRKEDTYEERLRRGTLP